MRPAEALSAAPFAGSSYGKLIAEARTTKPPALGDVGAAWALIVIGVIMVGIGVFATLEKAPWPVMLIMALIGLPMVVGGGMMLRKKKGQGGQLRVFESGVEVVTDGGAQLKATYEELEGVALDETELLNNGEHNGWVRTLTLWAKGQSIKLRSHIRGGDADAFGQTLDAILRKEAEQTDRSLAAGEVLRGEGWQLDRSGLKLESGLITQIDSFVQTGVNEGRAQAWRRGEEDPFFNVKIGSRNARTALGVIARHLPKDESARVVPGLGRRLFGKGMTRGMQIFWIGLGGFFAFPAILGAVLAGEPGMLFGAFFGGLIALIGIAGAKGGTNVHERGVRQKSIFGTKELKFLEVETYTHATTRHFYNGAYTGTSHNLAFVPVPGKGKKINLNFMARGNDEDMERLRDGMARIVAQGMYDRMVAGAQVPWSGATMAKDGIHFFETKLIGKGAPGVLPYAGSRYSFNQGTCFLYPPTGNKHVTQISCAGPNFFPGFELYMRMCSEAQQQTVAPVGVVKPTPVAKA